MTMSSLLMHESGLLALALALDFPSIDGSGWLLPVFIVLTWHLALKEAGTEYMVLPSFGDAPWGSHDGSTFPLQVCTSDESAFPSIQSRGFQASSFITSVRPSWFASRRIGPGAMCHSLSPPYSVPSRPPQTRTIRKSETSIPPEPRPMYRLPQSVRSSVPTVKTLPYRMT